jgi:hypothetical protein
MFPRPSVSRHGRSAATRRALCWGCAGLAFLASAWFVLHQPIQAAENALPNQVSPAPAAIQAGLVASYGKLPLSFEANQGQTDQAVKFLARGRGYALFLTADSAVLTLERASQRAKVKRQKAKGENPGGENRNWKLETGKPTLAPHHLSSFITAAQAGQRTTDHGPLTADSVLRMRLIGANTMAAVTGAEELPGKSNYFIGNDPKKWRTNVPTYAQVKYRDVYPGIDLVYYGNQGGQLEYDFVVAPGADPSAIKLDVGAVRELPSVAAGLPRHRDVGAGLVPAQGIVGAGLVPAQGIVGAGLVPALKGHPRGVPLRTAPDGDLVVETDGGDVRFHKPLVYQEESRGGQRTTDHGQRTAVEGHYILTASNEVRFALGAYDHNKPLVIDPILSYSTYLGGSGQDVGLAIAVDSSGNTYVTGWTNSIDFPTVNPIQANCLGCTTYGGWIAGNDAFVAKLNAAGSALVYSTYLGGAEEGPGSIIADGYGIAVDSSGNAYVTGWANSYEAFPLVNPCSKCYVSLNGGAFVAKLNPAGSALVYSTFLGGSGDNIAQGIAVDSSGDAYVTGSTNSTDFPTVNPLQTTGSEFLSKFNAAGSALVYSTYLSTGGVGIAVDSLGNAYVAGGGGVTKVNAAGSALVYSSTLANGVSIAVDSSGNAYVAGGGVVAKLNAGGSALVYSTSLLASGTATGIAVDSSGNAYVTGFTGSTDFPTVNPIQATLGGSQNAFVAELNAAGSALVYSTYLGGSGQDQATGIAVDSSGNAYVTGSTSSTNFPTANPLQASCGGLSNAFVAKILPNSGPWVSLSAVTLTFGSLNVDAPSAPQTVTVTNGGTANLTISMVKMEGADPGDFGVSADTCTGATLTPKDTCTVSATFTPSAEGSRSAFLNFIDNASNSPQPLSLSGTGTAPLVSLSTPSLNFGDQPVHTTAAHLAVTLTNTGTGNLTISTATIGGTNASDFAKTVDTCTGATVTRNRTCTVHVMFTPSAMGSRSGSLVFTDNNNGVVGSTQTVNLTGTGIGPVAAVSPSSLTFGNQNLRTTSESKPVTLRNTGSLALAINHIAISTNYHQTNDCPSSLAASGSCTISVTFSPTATGPSTGTLTITDNSKTVAGSKQTVSLRGTGVPAVAVTLNPTSSRVALSGTQLFTATTNAVNNALNWYANGVLNGNATQGTLTGIGLTRTYTAPVDVPNPNPVVIKVASVEDPAVFKTANVTVTDTIALTLSPASVSLALGGAHTFAATISNTTSTALKWYVNGVLNGNSAQGTLTACRTVAPLNCTYTAPDVNVPNPNPAVIKVVSVADPTKYKTASVTVTDNIVVTLSPATKTLALGGAQTFMATISNTTDTALTWYVNGVLKGNATQGVLTACTTVAPLNCTYTAPATAVPSPNPAVIKVVSVADPSKYKTASVTVTSP